MKKRISQILISCGTVLIAAAIVIAVCNLVEAKQAYEAAQKTAQQLSVKIEERDNLAATIDIPNHILNPYMEMPTENIDGREYIGTVEIPALGLSLPVISQWSYPALKVAPCRYYGSVYTNDLVIAAHNYAAHFGGIKSLHPGDTVRFTDVNGNVFEYEVVELETLGPFDAKEMKSGEWDLTLFTCTIGGKYRVTVRCEKN